MNDSECVREFTESPRDRPVPMSEEQVLFTIRMMMSELDELACTVSKDELSRDNLMAKALSLRDKCNKFRKCGDSVEEVIADQFDALVDSYYYSLNTAAKHGVNMSKIFKLVHQSNMNKRDPETGKFMRRPDGKIIKPPGWEAPNIVAEISRQIVEGAWE